MPLSYKNLPESSQLAVWVSRRAREFCDHLSYRIQGECSTKPVRNGKRIFFSFKPYIQKMQRLLYTRRHFKINIQMELRIPQPPSQESSGGGIHYESWKGNPAGYFPEHTTAAGLATITVCLHNRLYTTITLMVPNPNRILLKIKQTTQKGCPPYRR